MGDQGFVLTLQNLSLLLFSLINQKQKQKKIKAYLLSKKASDKISVRVFVFYQIKQIKIKNLANTF